MKLAKLSLALGLGLLTLGASAQTAQANMQVSASIAGSCTLTANPLAFGQYNPAATGAHQRQTTVELACSSAAGTSLAMGPGNNVTGTQRRLRLGNTGANYLNYSIYQPSGTEPGDVCSYTAPTAWGNGTGLGAALNIGASVATTTRAFNVCGEIPALQTGVPGSYVDTVQVVANL